MKYLVVHADRSMHIAATDVVVPPQDVAEFSAALDCANALRQLLASESARIDEAAAAARAAGHEAGMAGARSELEQAFAGAVVDAAHEFVTHQAAARRAVSELALAVVRKVAPTLGADALVPALVQQAVASLAGERAVQIRVHPDVATGVRTRLDAAGVDIAVRADDSLDLFGCIVDTLQGQLIAGLNEQLSTIERSLLVPGSTQRRAA